MALTFPSSPTNGQYYTDSVTGNRYVYNAASGVWTFAANNVGMSISSTPPANVASGALWYNREIGRTFVYYDDGDSKQWVETVPATGFFDSSTVAGYANAATQIYLTPVYNNANAAFNKANAALPNVSNAVFDGNLRVTGVLSIGSNTITITDKHIVANDYYRMNTSGHMVAVVDGNKVNAIYTVANSAFESANNVGPQVTPAYTTANLAYSLANTIFASSNADYVVSNSAFAKANAALANTTGTFAGTLSVTGDHIFSTNATYIRNKDGLGNVFRSYGINSANNFYIGPIDGYAGGAILYGVSPNVTEQYFYTTGSSRLYIGSTGFVGIGTTSPSVSLDLGSRTDAIKLPVGTTAQRPSGAAGMMRFNSTTSYPEWYDSVLGSWSGFNVGASYAVDYLVVAGGGGGGGGNGGGGGGAGGYLASSLTATSGSQYTVVVGSGGSGTASTTSTGSSGTTSSLALLSTTIASAVGGGGGGGSGNSLNLAGLTGGSGGGGTGAGSGASVAGGSGTAGQGTAGRPGWHTGGSHISGGGGGGSAAQGTAGSTTSTGQGGDGGNGTNWQSLGTFYAGGGGGGLHSTGTRAGNGGQGGGGAGSYLSTNNGTSGTTNTGGGGGGAGNSTTSGNGGSGVIIIRYLGAQRGTGGTVTSAGGYTYHTFTSSSTFTA